MCVLCGEKYWKLLYNMAWCYWAEWTSILFLAIHITQFQLETLGKYEATERERSKANKIVAETANAVAWDLLELFV